MESACGPTSQSAPFSRRHGEDPYGLPGANAETIHRAQAPCQSPVSSTAASHSRLTAENRLVKKTTEQTPVWSAASASRCAAAADVATGFSSSRCLPARAAWMASSAWTSGATANATAST